MSPKLKLAYIGAVLLTAGPLASNVRAQSAASQPDAPIAKPADPTTPGLVVATVKLDGGWRASKLIGATVFDDNNLRIGAVDDLIMAGPGRISNAIVSVGGFLGIGSKLVAIPYDQLRYDPTARDPKVIMPGATKDSLNHMPGFTYGDT